MAEVLKIGTVTITEGSEGGSVPDLKDINGGDVAALMLDGEELAGAKHNRRRKWGRAAATRGKKKG